MQCQSVQCSYLNDSQHLIPDTMEEGWSGSQLSEAVVITSLEHLADINIAGYSSLNDALLLVPGTTER